MAFIMPATKTQIRERLLHEYQLGRSVGQARQNISKALGYEAVPATTAKRWFRRFKQGDICTEDKPRSGRPKEIDKAAVLAEIEANPTMTTRMLSENFNCSHTAIEGILHAAGLRVRHGKWVPHDLTPAQKKKRKDGADELLTRQRSQPFLHRIVTCDEKWIPLDNRRCSNQWLATGQRPKATSKPEAHQKKVMLCVWWWVGGIIHWELLENGLSITAELYMAQLDRVQAKIRHQSDRSLFRRGVILQQDNARPHIANRTMAKIEELGWERLIHPPYSPDIAPSDYYLFRSLQHSVAGKRFSEVKEVKKHLSEYFASKSAAWYRRGIEKLSEKWQKTIDSNGAYFDL